MWVDPYCTPKDSSRHGPVSSAHLENPDEYRLCFIVCNISRPLLTGLLVSGEQGGEEEEV